MKSISSFSTIIIFTLFTLVGLSVLPLLNIQLNPSRTLPSVKVSFTWPENEARVVEQEVTSKLEAAFARIAGIKDINSTSEYGAGRIRLSLHKGTNIDAVRFEMSMLVHQVWQALPKGVSYPFIQADMPDEEREQPMLSYIVTAPLPPQQIKEYTEDEIKLKLSAIPGIGRILVSGAEPYEWLIEFDNNALKRLNLTLPEIETVINQYLQKEGLGLGMVGSKDTAIQSYTTSVLYLPVQVWGNSKVDNQLPDIPLKNCNGRIVYLSDIAIRKHMEAKAEQYYRVRGLNTINVSIFAAAGQNQLTLGKKVKQKIVSLKKHLPKGFKIEMEYDANEYIEHEISNLGWRFLLALALLLLFVLLIYRQVKFVFLILATFIVNLSIAAISYYMFNIEIHLYSLAGITVSLGLMTDNIIIMGDHLRNRGNLTVWLAILAGTMSMASTLIIIFFLDEKIKANLVDFALIVIVNQAVSLITALFFVPAMMKSLRITKNERNEKNEDNERNEDNEGNERNEKNLIYNINRKKSKIIGFRIKLALIRFQRWLYSLMGRWKWIPYTLFILGFGLPVFLLPPKWEGTNWYQNWYNKTLGSETYTSTIKPIVDKTLGGSLRLFVNYVFEGSYFRNQQETELYITASLPHGSTIEHANKLAQEMEQWLRQYKEIRTFQTTIQARQIWISVYFKKEFQASGFPYQLKGMAVSKAIELGGAYWGVYGFGDGFSNETRENAGMYNVKMMGYNYETLVKLAEQLKIKLMENKRLQEVYILPERSWFKPDNTGFVVSLNKEKSELAKRSPLDIFDELKNRTINNQAFATIYQNGKFENIKLQESKAQVSDVWMLTNMPLGSDSSAYRFNQNCIINKELIAQSVCKENQQYRIYLQFDYIGSDKFARKYIKKTVEQFRPILPIGYTVEDKNDWLFWLQNMNKNQYWLIGLVILLIFFICSILFESLRYPFAVILTIPVSFIGVFLTFYLFDLNFDQGGFASFILLCGLTVSAAIYIINDYSVLRRTNLEKKRSHLHLYLKAFQYKIIPVLLTISATILGFVPFLIGEKQAFWFSMAAGVCGGLVFALFGIFFYLPLFLGIKKK